MSAETLQFEASTHTYTLGGVALPSVTQVLKLLDQYEAVPPHVLEAAREFGTHVHLATELDDRGVLDEATLDPALAPYLDGWRRFRRESGFKIEFVEHRVVHKKLRYAGTIDRICRDVRGRRGVLDIKTGLVPKAVGPQVAAYYAALCEARGSAIESRRYCLQLMPHDYRLHWLNNPADWSVFVSCLNVWSWRNRNAH